MQGFVPPEALNEAPTEIDLRIEQQPDLTPLQTTLADLLVRQEESRNRKLSAAEKNAILSSVAAQYNRTLDPRYAAARLWIDKIIEWGNGVTS